MRLLLALVLLGACGGGGRDQPSARPGGERWQGALTPAPSSTAVVVAEVGDSRIYDVDVARYAGAHGMTPRQAVDELIKLELLAQEAVRRGLADDPEVADLRKRERVRVLLDRDFASGFTGPDAVPQADVDAAWANDNMRVTFDHPEYREARYFRIPVKTAEQVSVTRQQAVALRAAVIARAPMSADEFKQAAVEQAAYLGIPVETADKNYTTSLKRGPGDPTWAAIAFGIPEVGQISQPGATKWGWDVLYLVKIRPEVHMTKEEAAPEIRKRLFEGSRRRAFVAFTDRLMQGLAITRREDLLEAVEVESVAGGL